MRVVPWHAGQRREDRRGGRGTTRFGFRTAGRLAAVCSVLLYRLALPDRPAFPDGAPLLIVVNHRSLLDSVIGFHSFLRWGIEPRFLVHQRYFAHPILKRLLEGTGCVPVGSQGSSLALMRSIGAIYAAGHPVLIMPEGRVVPAEERLDGMGPAERGVGAIVKMFQPQVLAVGMVGTDLVWPPGRPRPKVSLGRRRPEIAISVGFVELPGTGDTDELKSAVEATMRYRVAEAGDLLR